MANSAGGLTKVFSKADELTEAAHKACGNLSTCFVAGTQVVVAVHHPAEGQVAAALLSESHTSNNLITPADDLGKLYATGIFALMA